MSFADESEAVERANASAWGLGGSVWSASYALAEQMDSGTVWINKHAELDPTIPFGGAKMSGLGNELGQEGLHLPSRKSSISPKAQLKRQPPSISVRAGFCARVKNPA